MSQFKKAMLKKYLSQEKEEENHSAAESEQQVGSAQNEPENPVSDAPLLEEESPSSPMSTISLVFTGKYWEIPLDTQDLDKDEFNPEIRSSPLPGMFTF